MFIHIDITDENLAKPFLTLFGLEEAENTVVSFPISKLNVYCTFILIIFSFLKNLSSEAVN